MIGRILKTYGEVNTTANDFPPEKLSFIHGYQRRFSEFPENERYHVSYLHYWLLIFFQIIFCHFDEISVLKSNITTYLIRNFETVSLKLLSNDLDCLMFGTKGIFLHSVCLCYKIKSKQ